MEGHSGLVAQRHHPALASPYKNVVKLTFAKGASLTDPARLFKREPRWKRAPRDRHP